jgi:hypothetical protein
LHALLDTTQAKGTFIAEYAHKIGLVLRRLSTTFSKLTVEHREEPTVLQQDLQHAPLAMLGTSVRDRRVPIPPLCKLVQQEHGVHLEVKVVTSVPQDMHVPTQPPLKWRCVLKVGGHRVVKVHVLNVYLALLVSQLKK